MAGCYALDSQVRGLWVGRAFSRADGPVRGLGCLVGYLAFESAYVSNVYCP